MSKLIRIGAYDIVVDTINAWRFAKRGSDAENNTKHILRILLDGGEISIDIDAEEVPKTERELLGVFGYMCKKGEGE